MKEIEELAGSPVLLTLIGIMAILNIVLLLKYAIRRSKMENRNNIIQIRVTEEELKNIDRLRNYWNMSRSGVVRRALAEKWRNEQKYVKEYEIFQEEYQGEK